MTKPNALPDSPTGSRFGWPRPARVEELRKLISLSKETGRVVFQNQLQNLPIVRVSIDLPKYRMANGRTSSLQAEFLVRDAKVRADLFSGDPELWDAQEAQHRLLLGLAKQADLRRYFENGSNQQVEPILLDESGFVVNGNRRLATWRDLHHHDSAAYSHFGHVDAVVLPHANERDIDRLEAALQIEKDIKADYVWHAEANMMLAKQKRDGFSNRDLADLYKMKESEVEELLDMRSYADEYLTSRGKRDHWSHVSEDELAFKKIVQCRRRIPGFERQELFKQVAFALIDDPAAVGSRLYEAIPAAAEHLEEIITGLSSGPRAEAGVPGDDAIDGIFGGGASSEGGAAVMDLARELGDESHLDDARTAIVDILETQRQLKKDSKDAGYLLECCSKAHSALAAAVGKGLRPEAQIDGVLAQLDQIEALSAKVREWLAGHAVD